MRDGQKITNSHTGRTKAGAPRCERVKHGTGIFNLQALLHP
jgi:hypothetical protein